ncbi:MAG: divalent metal cation transporter [Proteobacteria bacterium]|nr:divalent metal cation transporter [Pseudomonadota bacterium]
MTNEPAQQTAQHSLNQTTLGRLFRVLGPGLITGAADDDPSGIATYSQAGAQFGYGLTWTMILTLPFMAAIQIISACIGWGAKSGLARNIAAQLPKPVVYGLVGLLVVANTINIAADLAAMGGSFKLVAGGPSLVYAAGFGLACLIAEVLVPYHRYAGYLKFLTMVLFVYVIAAFSVDVPWTRVVLATVVPHVGLSRDLLLTIVAVFGTTISPYLFFWQASQEAEESRLSHRRGSRSGLSRAVFRHISIDTWSGMLISNLIAFFIIVTTAATLNVHGITHIGSAAQAAEALRPIAGEFTFALFAAGIIGTGLLAVPVLAGSAAYAVAEVFGLRGSLELPANRAIGFYSVIGAATLAGAALAATTVDPIAMLFWAAVINGFVAVPIMFAMMLIVSSERGLRLFLIPYWLRIIGWCAAVLMALTVLLLLYSSNM